MYRSRRICIHACISDVESLICEVGGADIIGRVVEDLKDASEPYRKMVMESIDMAGQAVSYSYRPEQSLKSTVSDRVSMVLMVFRMLRRYL